MITPAKGATMHKHRGVSIPPAQKVIIYSEGKQAFTKGDHRGYNPYSANNLSFATIWWNGWDTGEEESHAVRPSKQKA
jgi:hypothetical protein